MSVSYRLGNASRKRHRNEIWNRVLRNKGINFSKGHVMTSGCGFLWRGNAQALHGHGSIYRL